MKYIRIQNMVNRYDVLVLKDCGEHYVSSNAKKFKKEQIHEKIGDSWNFVDEITEEDFIKDVKRLIDCNRRSVIYHIDELIKLSSLLELEEL